MLPVNVNGLKKIYMHFNGYATVKHSSVAAAMLDPNTPMATFYNNNVIPIQTGQPFVVVDPESLRLQLFATLCGIGPGNGCGKYNYICADFMHFPGREEGPEMDKAPINIDDPHPAVAGPFDLSSREEDGLTQFFNKIPGFSYLLPTPLRPGILETAMEVERLPLTSAMRLHALMGKEDALRLEGERAVKIFAARIGLLPVVLKQNIRTGLQQRGLWEESYTSLLLLGQPRHHSHLLKRKIVEEKKETAPLLAASPLALPSPPTAPPAQPSPAPASLPEQEDNSEEEEDSVDEKDAEAPQARTLQTSREAKTSAKAPRRVTSEADRLKQAYADRIMTPDEENEARIGGQPQSPAVPASWAPSISKERVVVLLDNNIVAVTNLGETKAEGKEKEPPAQPVVPQISERKKCAKSPKKRSREDEDMTVSDALEQMQMTMASVQDTVMERLDEVEDNILGRLCRHCGQTLPEGHYQLCGAAACQTKANRDKGKKSDSKPETKAKRRERDAAKRLAKKAAAVIVESVSD